MQGHDHHHQHEGRTTVNQAMSSRPQAPGCFLSVYEQPGLLQSLAPPLYLLHASFLN